MAELAVLEVCSKILRHYKNSKENILFNKKHKMLQLYKPK